MAELPPELYRLSHEPAACPQFDDDSDLSAWREPTPESVRRRSFLKAVGFGVASLAAGGCQKVAPTKAIPVLQQPPGVTPGRPLYYATVCGACPSGCGMLTKCRDGRPIKLEGLAGHPVSDGGLCAVGQASLLGLYDRLRFPQPQQKGNIITWNSADELIRSKLKSIDQSGRAVCILSGTINSPTLQRTIDRFLATFANGRHIQFDALSNSAVADAHGQTHGIRAVPQFHFDRAEVIVGFDADFLGTWVSPVEFTAQRASGRNLNVNPPLMSYHVQFEPCMTITGSNADLRVPVAPLDVATVLAQLASEISRRLDEPFDVQIPATGLPVSNEILDDLANRLVRAAGKSLLVCGQQDLTAQKLCNYINQLLGNYGSTLQIGPAASARNGSDGQLAMLIDQMRQSTVGALLIHDVNPLYEIPRHLNFAAALDRVELVVQLAVRPDETTEKAHVVCPVPHFLESWRDCQVRPGVFAIGQPVIQPLFQTRPLMETLSIWMGERISSRDLIERYWHSNVYPQAANPTDFRQFFHQAIHDGWVRVETETQPAATFNRESISGIHVNPTQTEYTLVAYSKLGLLDGKHAYNPWLQELPDPVSKVTWDNYACVSVATAKRLNVEEGDVVRLDFQDDDSVELPVYIQPGTHDGVIAVALGYGSVATERFAGVGPQWIERRPTVGLDGRVGKNIADLLRFDEHLFRYWRSGLQITATGEHHPLASTQTYHKITVPQRLAPAGGLRRAVVQETTFADFLADPTSGHHAHHTFGPDIYPDDHPKTGHRWAMAVDLNACTGCSACVIACQAENNISVVGKDEVRRRRDMHWMRIDRYYSGEGDEVDVVHQPMMCQHCDNAPCENVCPVLATVHTAEGLNAQVYNRCVGTRYCANNCAYKVRRFNWFHYDRADPLENLVLNPDVTVRSRGVMEKCTFCVQRLQNAKIEAKRVGRPVADDDVQTACQQSCPARAIEFGDVNNRESRVSRLLDNNPRAFRVLEEIGVEPSVYYMTLVRNRQRAHEAGGRHHG